MADRRDSRARESRRLNARGSREIVYCHQCELDWYRDDHGLTCPRCDGDITEIISPDTDPRHRNTSPPDQALRQGFPPDPWRESNSDPDEADIEEHVTHGPNGSMFVRTMRSSSSRNRARLAHAPGEAVSADPGQEEILRNFQSMLGNLLGPGVRIGQPGRSGPETLFSGPGWSGSIRVGGEGGPQFTGGAFTFSSRRGGESANRAVGGAPQMEHPFSLLDSMFGQMRPINGQDHEAFGNLPGHQMPQHMPGLFAGLFNPVHAVSGDAVYSQEALDRIMSQLMEQHPTSNAPGPATKSDIDALPKRKLTEKTLGPEGKGECSVCMDDVYIGDEVVFLPCNHWFHDACASAWLSEHNTCPICRTGISGASDRGEKQDVNEDHQPGQGSNTSQYPWAASLPGRRPSTTRHSPSTSRHHGTSSRNEDRLNAIRNAGMMSSPERQGSAFDHDNSPSRRSTVPNVDAQGARNRRNVNDLGPTSSDRPRRQEYDDDSQEATSSHRRKRASEADGQRRHDRDRDRDRDRERDRDRREYGSGGGSSADYARRVSRHEGLRSRDPNESGSGAGSGVSSWLRDRWGSGRH